LRTVCYAEESAQPTLGVPRCNGIRACRSATVVNERPRHHTYSGTEHSSAASFPRRLVQGCLTITCATPESRRGCLDALIVPASRPAECLKPLLKLATSLSVPLIILCSKNARADQADQVEELVARKRGAKSLIVQMPDSWQHAGLPARTLQRRLVLFCREEAATHILPCAGVAKQTEYDPYKSPNRARGRSLEISWPRALTLESAHEIRTCHSVSDSRPPRPHIGRGSSVLGVRCWLKR
jgi:hypothetical protein